MHAILKYGGRSVYIYIYICVCGSVTLRNVNEMRNAISAPADAPPTFMSPRELTINDGRRRGQSETPTPVYPAEEEAEGKNNRRRAKK